MKSLSSSRSNLDKLCLLLLYLGTLHKKRHQQRMSSLAIRSYLAYKQEVDYGGFNELNIYI
jgi:hypothetical protein